MNIPIYKAKKINSNEYIEGYLMAVVEEDNLCSIREENTNYVGGYICVLNTLSISYYKNLKVEL